MTTMATTATRPDPSDQAPAEPTAAPAAERIGPVLLRGAFGGTLMGLANLVPGISGGTMLLAVGIYPRFIAAVSEVTTFRFRKLSLLTLACVLGAGVLAITSCAGLVKDLVVDHRWVMYAIFIGLTLGGLPLVWRLIGSRRTASTWVGAAAGLAVMVVVTLAQSHGGGGGGRDSFGFLVLAGVLGASAMILPGISGGYLLLVLGVYVPILAAVDTMKTALAGMQLDVLLRVGLQVILPVGIGVVVGVVAVSNLLRWLLERFRQPTLGVLLGLLLGAVVGLWPFQQGVPPAPGDIVKGQTVLVDGAGRLILAETGLPVAVEDYPTGLFRPLPMQVAGALGLVVAGFLVTQLVDRLGREERRPARAA